jgi:RND superfamily putative drug exporter
MDVRESIARAVATSGGAVVFAGSTVVVAVCSLAVARIPLVTTLGLMTGVMVALAIVCALTLVPAVLALVGARINALPLPGRRPGRPLDVARSRWARFAAWIIHHRLVSVAGVLAVLIPLSIPAFSLHFGQTDVGALPTSETARRAYDAIARGFGVGANGPIVVAASLAQPTQADDPSLGRLHEAIAGADGVAAVTPLAVDRAGTVATFNAVPRSAPSDRATEDLLDTLRATTVPAATRGTGVDVALGGSTAAFVDLGATISDRLPETIAVVIGLSAILLLVAFRSLAIPAKAAVMNLLSIGAAYGVVVMVFQYGWFAGLVGLDGAVPIASFVPLLMFAGLFGLSMDYEVFLLSRVQERYRAGEAPRAAIVTGMAVSARVITAAALIMVSVFASFVLNGDPVVKQFGVGLSVAVIVDATLVRCVLVPAAMALLGRAAWWLPGSLDRVVPPLDVEGQSWLAARDAAAGTRGRGGGRAAAGETEPTASEGATPAPPGPEP